MCCRASGVCCAREQVGPAYHAGSQARCKVRRGVVVTHRLKILTAVSCRLTSSFPSTVFHASDEPLQHHTIRFYPNGRFYIGIRRPASADAVYMLRSHHAASVSQMTSLIASHGSTFTASESATCFQSNRLTSPTCSWDCCRRQTKTVLLRVVPQL
jgi:hypothetical protein